jgi:hypothetical protein
MKTREFDPWFDQSVLWNGNRRQFFQGKRKRLQAGGWDMLMLTRYFDEIQLDENTQDVLPNVLDHYRRAGLEPTEHITWHQRGSKKLPQGWQYMPCGLNRKMAPKNIRNSQEILAWDSVIRRCASKEAFTAYAKKRRFSGLMPRTLSFKAGQAPVIPSDFGPGWVKDAEREVTGESNVIGPLEGEDLLAAAKRFASTGFAYQVQQHVEGVDVSMQYLAVRTEGKTRLHYLATTEQVVHKQGNGAHHAGNRWGPSVPDLGALTNGISEGLVADGMQGFFGIDARSNGLTQRITEPNLRINGSSAVLVLAKMYGFDEGLVIREMPVNRHLSLDQRFSRIRSSGLEFNVDDGGVLVHNAGYRDTLGVAVIGSEPQAKLDEISKRLVA